MVKVTKNNLYYFIISFSKEKESTQVTEKNRRPMQKKTLHGMLAFEWFSFSLGVLFAFMTKKRVSRRLTFIAIWNNKISTSLLGEIMVPPYFHLDPMFSTEIPCFPPDPVFSTPFDFQTPCFPHPGTPYPGTPTSYPGSLAPRFPPSPAKRAVIRWNHWAQSTQHSRRQIADTLIVAKATSKWWTYDCHIKIPAENDWKKSYWKLQSPRVNHLFQTLKKPCGGGSTSISPVRLRVKSLRQFTFFSEFSQGLV